MSINPEKQSIINHEGNILVTANPGTGKTLLLAHKYVDLLKNDVPAEQILCLTFTEKAKREMENRIIKVLKEEKQKIDLSKLNVYTFHSYALENIEEKEVLSPNLLRYSIFEYLKSHEVLNYGDEYLIETIVPKIESLIRYLKSFGVMPDDINLGEVRQHLEEGKSYSKEEIDKFAGDFLAIYKHYEELKNKRGLDYNDMLIRFHSLKNPPRFDYVLVDELQDVNVLEADIALKSAKSFFCVGDKKQAIFGFQGGSILNFSKFADSKAFVLSENFRSTDQVLDYARSYFTSHTNDEGHAKNVKDLHSAKNKSGPKPVIYDVKKDNMHALACDIANELEGKTAIITRTNSQIASVCAELKARGMDHATTFFSASDEARMHIIDFLRGIFSPDVQDVKNSMFTPFFPCSLQEAFQVSQEDLGLDGLLNRLPAFKKLRESVSNIEDVNKVFLEKIIPVSITYGKEYLISAMGMQEAFIESLSVLDARNLENFTNFLKISDLLAQDTESEKRLVVSTVHKAKGREFENVIYIPSRTNKRSNYADKVVEAVLLTKGISAEEELEEETLRVNFVAFTRAEKNLFILTEKIQDYLNDASSLGERHASEEAEEVYQESRRRAYDLFINGQYDEAKSLIESRESWIRDFVKSYFESLDHTSFSALPESAFDYFCSQILSIGFVSTATSIGSEVHSNAQNLLEGREFVIRDEVRPFMDNVNTLVSQIKKEYPEVYHAEKRIHLPLSDLGFESSLSFKGFIDAVFRNGDEYLIVDWKTDKNENYNSKHRQQLEVYRRAFAARFGVPLENVKVAIGYVGLRSAINTGEVGCNLDMRQPAKSAFETFSKRVERLLSWIGDVDKFFEEFASEEVDDLIWRSVVEEYSKNEKTKIT